MTIVVWIICGLACGFLAKKKARRVGLWTFLGLGFGIFSLITILFLPEVTGTGEFKKCTKCLSVIPQAATKCSHCQSDVAN